MKKFIKRFLQITISLLLLIIAGFFITDRFYLREHTPLDPDGNAFYVIHHDVADPMMKVWAAVSKPELVALWSMQPQGYQPVVNSTYKLMWKPNKAWRGYFDCKILEIVPHHKLRYLWDADGKSAPLYVTFYTTPNANETRVTMTMEHASGLFSRVLTKLVFGRGMKDEVSVELPKVLADMNNDGTLKAGSKLTPRVTHPELK